MVDLVNKSQLDIKYPEGVLRIENCLNMKKDDAPLIICDVLEFTSKDQNLKQIREQYPSKVLEIGD